MESEVIVIGVGVAPIIALMINPLKKYIPSDLMVYVAIGCGLAWTLVFHWTQDALAKDTVMASIMLGVATGLAATGAHSVSRSVRDRI